MRSSRRDLQIVIFTFSHLIREGPVYLIVMIVQIDISVTYIKEESQYVEVILQRRNYVDYHAFYQEVVFVVVWNSSMFECLADL